MPFRHACDREHHRLPEVALRAPNDGSVSKLLDIPTARGVPPNARSGRGRTSTASLSTVLSFTPPMLATSGRPDGPLDGWVLEPKADGWRAQVAVDGHGSAVWTRTGRDITAKVPR